jgi:hypothetical protein
MYRSGNRASVMKYKKELGKESPLPVFGPMPPERRKKPIDAGTSSYFV